MGRTKDEIQQDKARVLGLVARYIERSWPLSEEERDDLEVGFVVDLEDTAFGYALAAAKNDPTADGADPVLTAIHARLVDDPDFKRLCRLLGETDVPVSAMPAEEKETIAALLDRLCDQVSGAYEATLGRELAFTMGSASGEGGAGGEVDRADASGSLSGPGGFAPPRYFARNLEPLAATLESVGLSGGLDLHELISSHVHLDVLAFAPTDRFPHLTLVTSGMGDLPMAQEGPGVRPTDPPRGHPAHCELAMLLPPEFAVMAGNTLDGDAMAQLWQVSILKQVGLTPHQTNTLYWRGHTIDAVRPLSPETAMTALLIDESRWLPERARRFKGAVGEPVSGPEETEDYEVSIFTLMPLHADELGEALAGKADYGTTLAQRRVSQIFDLSRPSAARSHGRRGRWFAQAVRRAFRRQAV